MRTTSFAAAAVAAATTAVLTVGLAGPASAESARVTDPADVRHGVDLRAVRVNHGPYNLRVTLQHKNLRRDYRSAASGAVYIDTDPADRGPELVLVGGFFEGTDYILLETEGFGPRKWGEPVQASYKMTLDYTKDQTKVRISRAALGRPDRARVAVKVGGDRRDGTRVVDWMRKPFAYTPWVARD